ncbi:hypothetical protein OG478_13685 [Streptomyces phaeochromogenes]|uniref:hypothetical protein n=1 Tax=Streptomyces phaeochromogenes TaxID=1923 RepID=UPI0038640C0E|nr:hypothetical protein OG478_13685 [Streptomyces phaeochromogenes]
MTSIVNRFIIRVFRVLVGDTFRWVFALGSVVVLIGAGILLQLAESNGPGYLASMLLAGAMLLLQASILVLKKRQDNTALRTLLASYGQQVYVPQTLWYFGDVERRRLETPISPEVARTRVEYRESLSADPLGYQERLDAAQLEIQNDEAEEGIEDLSVLLGASSGALDPTSPESRHAMDYAASSVVEVFRLIGPPPPGIGDQAEDSDGGVPDPGAGVPSGGRRG